MIKKYNKSDEISFKVPLIIEAVKGCYILCKCPHDIANVKGGTERKKYMVEVERAFLVTGENIT